MKNSFFKKVSFLFSVLLFILTCFSLPNAKASDIDLIKGEEIEVYDINGVRIKGKLIEYSKRLLSIEYESVIYKIPEKEIALIKNKDETEGRFHFRSGLYFFKKDKFDIALNIFFYAKKEGESPDSVHYFISKCFSHSGKYDLALGANYGINDTNSIIKPAALLQRCILFKELGLIERSEKLSEDIIELYPKTSYARKCRRLLGKEKSRWIPRVTLHSKAYWTRQESEYNEDYSNTENIEWKDTTISEWNGNLHGRCLWNLLKSKKLQLRIGPEAEIRMPFNRDYIEFLNYGAGLNIGLNPSSHSNHTWGFSYTRSHANEIDPANKFTLNWSYFTISKSYRFWILSTSGSLKKSIDVSTDEFNKYQNEYMILSTASVDPAFRIGKRVSINTVLTGIFSYPEEVGDLGILPQRIYADEIEEGDSLKGAIYYSDSTYYVTVPYNDFRVFHDIPRYFLFDRNIGPPYVSTYRFLQYGLEISLDIKLSNMISIVLFNSWDFSYYPLPYKWDNFEYPVIKIMGLETPTLFYNKIDKEEYYIKTQISPASVSFHKYERYEKIRIDNSLRFKPGFKFSSKSLGKFLLYIKITTNFSSLDDVKNSPFKYGYQEIVPGFEWSRSF